MRANSVDLGFDVRASPPMSGHSWTGIRGVASRLSLLHSPSCETARSLSYVKLGREHGNPGSRSSFIETRHLYITEEGPPLAPVHITRRSVTPEPDTDTGRQKIGSIATEAGPRYSRSSWVL